MSIIAFRIVEVCVFKFEKDQPKYLLLHRSKTERIYPGIWQLISGSIEEGEKAVNAALREFKEETGLMPKKFWVVPYAGSFYDPDYDALNLTAFFAAEVDEISHPKLCEEHYEYGWFSYEETVQKLVWPGQKKGLEIVHEYIVKGQEAGVLTEIKVRD